MILPLKHIRDWIVDAAVAVLGGTAWFIADTASGLARVLSFVVLCVLAVGFGIVFGVLMAVVILLRIATGLMALFFEWINNNRRKT